MILSLEKKNWFMLLVIACLAFTMLAPTTAIADDWDDDEDRREKRHSGDDDDDRDEYDDDDDRGGLIRATGKGSRKKYALANAWRKAIMKFLEDNIDEDDLEAHEQKVEKWLDENWQEYTTGNWKRPSRRNVVAAWDRDEREITIRVRLEESRLLKDIKRLTQKVRNKLKGLKIGIALEKKSTVKVGDEWLDRSTMFAALTNILGGEMTIVDLDAAMEALKNENLANEVSAHDDPSGYSHEIWNLCNLKVLLSLKTRAAKDPATGTNTWFATISCRMLDVQTGQQMIYFQMENGRKSGAKPVSAHIRGNRKARDLAIEGLAQVTARKIIDQCRKRKTIAKENVYTLKFIGFDRKGREKIEEMVSDLSRGRDKDMKVEESTGSGTKMVYKIKWLRTKDSQHDIVYVLKESLRENRLRVDSSKSRQGIIWFEPVGYEGYDE